MSLTAAAVRTPQLAFSLPPSLLLLSVVSLSLILFHNNRDDEIMMHSRVLSSPSLVAYVRIVCVFVENSE